MSQALLEEKGVRQVSIGAPPPLDAAPLIKFLGSVVVPVLPTVFTTLHSDSIHHPMFLVFVTHCLTTHLWGLMTPLLAVVAIVSLCIVWRSFRDAIQNGPRLSII